MIANEKLKALLPAAEMDLARRSLIDFSKRMMRGFEDPSHIRLMAEYLEKIESGELRRLMISMPPRHGKSYLGAQLFPSWYLGRNPRSKVIVASYGATLAQEHSRASRALLQQDNWPFETRLSEESSAVDRWHTTDRGQLLAAGVGSGITGFGADLFIIDDAHHDVGTEGERELVWQWFTRVAMPRLEPAARLVVIGTRWAFGDLIGRQLEAPDAAQWKHIVLPAIATDDDDAIGRKVGEPLWAERMNLEMLLERKTAMGANAFEGEYQQRPVPEEGALWRKAWLENRYRPEDLARLQSVRIGGWPATFEAMLNQTSPGQSNLQKVVSVDSAWKTGPGADYSAMMCWGTDGLYYWLLDAKRGRWEYPDLKRVVVDFCQLHRPNAVPIESAASGLALISELKRTTGLPIIESIPHGSKESRASVVLPLFESGKVKLPEKAPYLDEYVAELLSFPAGRHDDYVDCTVLALTRLYQVAMAMQAARQPLIPIDWMSR